MRFSLLFLLAVTPLASACATTPAPAATETISVSRRPLVAICAGVCPNYDLTVASDGRVEVRWIRFDEPDEIERFTVSRGDAARFAEILRPLRPEDGSRVEANCWADRAPDPLKLGGKEMEVIWDGPSPAHLVACAKEPVLELFRQANRTVGLDPSGFRIDH